jgi:hypothetical protein
MPQFGFDTTAEEAGDYYKENIRGKNGWFSRLAGGVESGDVLVQGLCSDRRTFFQCTVLITGASPNSLGAEAARVIAKHQAGALLILAGRNRANLEATEKMIKSETPGANIRILDLDLADFESVRRAGDEVR